MTVRLAVGHEVLRLAVLEQALRAAGTRLVRLETDLPSTAHVGLSLLADVGLRVLVVLADDAPTEHDTRALQLVDAHLARLLPPGTWLALVVRDATMAADLQAADAVGRLAPY